MAASVAVVALAVGAVVASTSATTRALFSDTVSGADSRVGTATVELGDGGGEVQLGYTDLRPGRRQTVDLTISYHGTVPADVTLEIAPSGDSALCVQRKGRWQSRPGGAVTVRIGSAEPVSYCELLNGLALPLASAVPPGSERHVDVAVMLSKEAYGNMRGLVEKDVATVRARGGFTDHAVGTISISTAGRDKHKEGDPRGDGKRAGDAAAPKSDPDSAAVPGSTPGNPTSGTSSTPPPATLPVECERAGMRLDSFEDVIVLGPDQHIWKASNQRGQGAGPFLIVGADGDNEIIGSEGADCIVGGGARDTLAGGAGADVLIGGAEVDLLDGGPGNDWLLGGSGVDDLRGGGGIDRFDGGPDGAACDAGRDAAGVSRCQAAASSTSAGGGTDEEATSPTTTSPPPTTSAPPTASPPTTPTAAPASAGSTPSTAPTTAQAGPPSDGTAYASAPRGGGEDPSAASTEACTPPASPIGFEGGAST